MNTDRYTTVQPRPDRVCKYPDGDPEANGRCEAAGLRVTLWLLALGLLSLALWAAVITWVVT